VTMVAAWMSADTGVGPSMASRSQACSGTCADLPQAAEQQEQADPGRPERGQLRGAPAFTAANEVEPNIASIVD
jgi:hypothetical protein